MKICRVRNFKNSVELTVSFTAEECEDLSHVISVIPTEHKETVYPEKKERGRLLLNKLNDKIFWTHWKSNFACDTFEPEGNFQ